MPARVSVLLGWHFSLRRKGKRVSSVMEGGQEVLKRESMGRRFKGELKDLVERIHSTEVRITTPVPVSISLHTEAVGG